MTETQAFLFSALPFVFLNHSCVLKGSFPVFLCLLESELSSSILIMNDALILPPSWEPWACAGRLREMQLALGLCILAFFRKESPSLFSTSSKSQGEKAPPLPDKTSGILGILK